MNRFDNINRIRDKYRIGNFDSYGIVYDETHEFSDEGYIFDWDWMDKYMKSLPYSDRI